MLKKMTSFHSVSGLEEEFTQWLLEELKPFAKNMEVDRVGNLIASRGKIPAVGP